MEMEKKTEKKKIIQVLECVSDGKQRHSRRRSWDSQGLGVIAVSSSLRAKVGLHGMLANLFLGFVPKMPPPILEPSRTSDLFIIFLHVDPNTHGNQGIQRSWQFIR